MTKRNILSVIAISAFLFLAACKDVSAVEGIEVISPLEMKEAVYENGAQQLVDVRTIEEFRAGHLKNAHNISVTDADFEENILKLDKDKPIYLYCRSGKRSANAAKMLKDLGFNEIYDLKGGYLNWDSQNLETAQ